MGKKVLALGYFDGVHVGHAALLKACRELADALSCEAGVATFAAHPDALVYGKPPVLINTPAQREKLLQKLGKIDTVITLPFDRALMQTDYADFFRMLVEKHDAIGFVCGDDFRFGWKGLGDGQKLAALCAAAGLACRIVPQQKLDGITVSSTCIRTFLMEGQLEKANRFLGHPHLISGAVAQGKQLGRTLGIPTANLLLPEELVCPRRGVYACRAHADGKNYLAVANVGVCPTVGGQRLTVEAWLLDFDGDLYGRELELELHAFLRPEQKFESLSALQAEIRKNAAQTREFFEKM